MLDSLRTIERVIYKNPTIDKDSYPALDNCETELLEIDSLTFDYGVGNLCSVYIREFEDSWFVDVYYFRCHDDNGFDRKYFVIAPGYQMSEENEDTLFDLNEDIFVMYNNRTCEDFYAAINRVAPELHVLPYADISKALLHVYFASRRSGMRELLYKAGLNYIAAHLSEIDGFNIVPANIGQAFDVPVKMMRKLNHKDGIKALSSDGNRCMAKRVYRNFHSILNAYDRLNLYQIMYFDSCMYGLIPAIDKRIVRVLGAPLNKYEGWDSEREEYIDGEALCNDLISGLDKLRRIFPWYRSLAKHAPDRFWAIMEVILNMLPYMNKVDQRMLELSEGWKGMYLYRDSKYAIVIPESMSDIMLESARQRNCLYMMYKDILNGITAIMFVRRQDSLGKSLITVAIEGGRIAQARGFCNRDLTEEEAAFLETFAWHRGLECNLHI